MFGLEAKAATFLPSRFDLFDESIDVKSLCFDHQDDAVVAQISVRA